jgi:hypothetical protein
MWASVRSRPYLGPAGRRVRKGGALRRPDQVPIWLWPLGVGGLAGSAAGVGLMRGEDTAQVGMLLTVARIALLSFCGEWLSRDV